MCFYYARLTSRSEHVSQYRFYESRSIIPYVKLALVQIFSSFFVPCFCRSRDVRIYAQYVRALYCTEKCSATQCFSYPESPLTLYLTRYELPLSFGRMGEANVKCYAPSFPFLPSFLPLSLPPSLSPTLVNSVNIVDTLCCDQSESSSLRG